MGTFEKEMVLQRGTTVLAVSFTFKSSSGQSSYDETKGGVGCILKCGDCFLTVTMVTKGPLTLTK